MVGPAQNEKAQFTLALNQDTWVSLKIYDLAGRHTATVTDEGLSAGNHLLAWDGGNAGSGSYFVYVEAEGHRARGQVVVIR